jgi:riboflavin transporter FmnP
MRDLFQSVVENAVFVAEFFMIIVGLILVAVLIEKAADKKMGVSRKFLNTRKVAMIGMFSAIAMVLMLFELPMPFAPPFYKLDLSELPVLIGGFAFGPAAGIMIEFAKILLKLFVKGTTTAFVGELANFVVGCSFVLPATSIYAFWKKKKGAITGCVLGTLILTVFGSMFNAIYLLPAFSKLFGMPLDSILEMGSAANPLMTEGSMVSFIVCCVVPINLIKGAVVSTLTMIVYKPLSPILKSAYQK